MSYTFSTNSGSLDSLNPSVRWGLSSKAFQIRPIEDFDSPVRSAIFARDQCVASFGVVSKVATTTSSTCSAVMLGGRPGLGSSDSPSKRCSTNRDRHLPTVAAEQPSSAATTLLSAPSAHLSTMRERSARACEDFRRLTHRCSCARSSSLSSRAGFGRPDRGMPHSTIYLMYLRRNTLAAPAGYAVTNSTRRLRGDE